MRAERSRISDIHIHANYEELQQLRETSLELPLLTRIRAGVVDQYPTPLLKLFLIEEPLDDGFLIRFVPEDALFFDVKVVEVMLDNDYYKEVLKSGYTSSRMSGWHAQLVILCWDCMYKSDNAV